MRARWHPVDAPGRVTPEGVPSGSRDARERLTPEGVPSGRPTREESLSQNWKQPASAAATQAQGTRPCHSLARAGASSPAPSGVNPASSGPRTIRDLASIRGGGTTSRTNQMDSPTHDAPERMTPEGVPLGSRDGAVGREAKGRAKRGRDTPMRDTRPEKRRKANPREPCRPTVPPFQRRTIYYQPRQGQWGATRPPLQVAMEVYTGYGSVRNG